jgi:hypothetical protein
MELLSAAKAHPNEAALSVQPSVDSKLTISPPECQAGLDYQKASSNVLQSLVQPQPFDHPHVSASESEEIECQTWDVVLSKRVDATKFGFSYVSYREIFLKRLGGCGHQHLSRLAPAPNMLLVKRVVKDTLLDEWNCMNPSSLQVCASDKVAQVNEQDTIDGMESALLSDEIRMRMVRYPERFHVDLVKREAVGRWGFKFGRSEGGLRIADLSSDGLLREHNEVRMSQGLFHLVVLPGMWIEAANGMEGDLAQIKAEIRRSDSLHLRFRRADLDGLTSQGGAESGARVSSAELSPSAAVASPVGSLLHLSQQQDMCANCGYGFVPDAAFCQMCGTARPAKPPDIDP